MVRVFFISTFLPDTFDTSDYLIQNQNWHLTEFKIRNIPGNNKAKDPDQ